MQDEVLAHRMGLVPLKIDPRLVEFKRKLDPSYLEALASSQAIHPLFKREVIC